MSERGSGSGELALAFLVGAMAGAALALLFAPVPGREAREFLGHKAREKGDRASALAQEAQKLWSRARERKGKEMA